MGFELVDASVDVRRRQVVLRYVTSGEMPDSGAVTFTTTFTDRRVHRATLGHKHVDGRVESVFRCVPGHAMNDHVDVWPIMSGDIVTILYPIDDVQGRRTGEWRAQWKWTAEWPDRCTVGTEMAKPLGMSSTTSAPYDLGYAG
jgi:hypothetical protein